MSSDQDLPVYNSYSALVLARGMLAVDIKDTTFDEWVTIIVPKLGINLADVKFSAKVGKNGIVKTPCKTGFIKHVTTNFIVYQSWDAKEIEGVGVKTLDQFGNTEVDYSVSHTSLNGEYVDFTKISDDTLKVTNYLDDSTVFINAFTPVVDQEGKYLFTLKQIEAIAYYTAFLYQQREFLLSKKVNPEYMERQAAKRIAASRVPCFVSDNSWDALLDIQSMIGSKRFNDNVTLP